MELDLRDEEVAHHQIVSRIESPSFDVLVVRNVPANSATGPFLRSLATARGWAYKRLDTGVAPFVRLEGRWDQFFRQRRSKKSRHNLNRSGRRLAEMGGHIVHYSTAGELNLGLDAAFSIAEAEPRGMGTRWSIDDPAARSFYRAVATRFAEQEEFDLAILEIGGVPSAFAWSIKRGTTWYYHHARAVASSNYAFLSPGSALLVHLLQLALEKGFKTFDFMLGDEAYKRAWATDQQVLHTYFVTRRSMRSLSAWQTERAMASARLLVRGTPILRRATGSLLRTTRRR